MKPYPDKYGYPTVRLTINGIQARYKIHRLLTLTYLGPCPAGMVVRHLDGDPTNCALSNLAYGTLSENMRDSLRHGTHAYAFKTHCKYGHPFDEQNTRVTKRPMRVCKTCEAWRSRTKQKAKMAAKRGLLAATSG